MAERMVTCPSCHKKVPAGSWCPLCGAAIGKFAWLAGLGEEAPPPPIPAAGNPGWYPAADTPGQQRYWDGYRWNGRVRRAPDARAGTAQARPPEQDQKDAASDGVDPVDQLERLARLKAAEAITEEEFEEAKRRLLDRI